MNAMNFMDWFNEHEKEIKEFQEFTKQSLPDDPVNLARELDLSQSGFARAGYLLADVESILLDARARETLGILKDHADLAAPERKIIVESRVNQITRTRDILQVIVSAMRQKCFAIMNLNKTAVGDGTYHPE